MNHTEHSAQQKAFIDRAVKTITFKVREYGERYGLGNIDIMHPEDFEVRFTACSNAYVNFRHRLYSHKVKDVEYPADWWEAFKDRWFPSWLKRRYPVKMKYIAWRAVLANIPIKDQEVRVHMFDASDYMIGKWEESGRG